MLHIVTVQEHIYQQNQFLTRKRYRMFAEEVAYLQIQETTHTNQPRLLDEGLLLYTICHMEEQATGNITMQLEEAKEQEDMCFMSDRIYLNYDDIVKEESVVVDYLAKKFRPIFRYCCYKKTLFTIASRF